MSMNKVVFFTLSVLLFLNDITDGKKVRRKRPKTEEEASYLQPNVLTYSNFGFNDVGSYDGFVPSSPDYATFLRGNGGKVESTTRLYGPAFPTAMETSGFSSGFESQLSDGQSLNMGNNGQQLGLFHLEPNTMNSFTNSFTNVDSNGENKVSGYISMNRQNTEKSNLPVYGAKLNMKSKSKPYEDFNDPSFKTYTTDPPPTTTSNEKTNERYYKTKKRYHSYDNKQTTTESSGNQNKDNDVPNYPINVEPFMKTPFNHSSNLLNFPRVIDFTNTNKQFYQNDFQVNYPPQVNTKPLQMSNPVTTAGQDSNSYSFHGDKFFKVSSSIKNAVEYKDDEDKKVKKFNSNFIDDESHNRSPKFKGTVINVEYKDKFKAKPWKTSNNDLSINTNSSDTPVSSSKFVSNFEDFKSDKNSMLGYQYSSNHSSTSFKYDVDEGKKPFKNSVDEIVPASSNIDLLDYQVPNTDFTNLNKIANLKTHYQGEHDLSFNTPNEYNPSEDYLNKFKNFYTTTPISTSNWGNIFKSTDYTFNKSHKRKPEYGYENTNDEIVHIPKRPLSQNYGKYDFKSGETQNEFPYYSNYRQYKPQRPQYDWGKEISSTRFKAEEDLLGLRTRDTLRPSFLPTFSSTPNEVADDNNYKRLIEKWRTDYLKSKQKELFNYHDYETYASDAKPVHVPLPKPYPIQVPHPVIVPVPEPYPVRVPVPKPVAVPVIQELMVPIEKPVPYPIVKKVPYPIEKLVPVPVEKQVPVPVEKPYPVPIPQIRPVFHPSKHRDEYNNLDLDDDDYVPRPESSKRVPYVKRPRNTRNRQRRPSRTAYSDHSRRRWPQTLESKERRHYKRHPTPLKESPYPRYKHNDREPEEFENEDRDLAYCRKTGNC